MKEKQKEMGRLKAAVRRELVVSTVPAEITLLRDLAFAMDAMLRDIDKRIRAAYARNGLVVGRSETIPGFADYCKAVSRASCLAENSIDKCAENGYTASGAFGYDQGRYWGNEIARLVMLITDRTRSDGDGYTKLMDFLTAMPSLGKFRDSDILRFVMK